ncbi:hypothetical protein Q0N07_14775, partial [Staphylococcus aureus]|nr:hypothetical protein [Staphylococcus aureus]
VNLIKNRRWGNAHSSIVERVWVRLGKDLNGDNFWVIHPCAPEVVLVSLLFPSIFFFFFLLAGVKEKQTWIC